MVQWLGLCARYAGSLGLIPDRGTRSHMLQLKIPHAAPKTWCSQIKINVKKTDKFISLRLYIKKPFKSLAISEKAQ